MTTRAAAWLVGIALVFVGLQDTGTSIAADQAGSSDTRADDAVAYHERRREAASLYAAGDFAKAATLYQKLAEANPEDGDNWLRLARCRSRLKEDRQAIEAFGRANELGFGHLQRNSRDIARAYARLGENEKALEWLEKALREHRFEFRPSLRDDEAFRGLDDNARFRELAGLRPRREFTRDEGWRYDLDYLLGEIKRLNATYSQQPLPAPVREAAEQLRERIPKLADDQIAVEMMRLLALLGHSHNNLFGSAEGGRVTFTQLPLTFYLFPEGLYVIDGEGDLKELVGSRVVRFDDTPAEAAVRAVGSLVKRENDMEARWLGPPALAMPQVLHGLGLTKSADEVRLTVARHGGEE